MLDLLEYNGFFCFYYMINNDNNRETVEKQEVSSSVFGSVGPARRTLSTVLSSPGKNFVKNRNKKIVKLDYQPDLHIQKLMSLLPLQRALYDSKNWTENSSILRLRLFLFVCFSTNKDVTGHRFGFILQRSLWY